MHIEMHAFPAVQQGAAWGAAVREHMVAQVAVQAAAGACRAAVAVYDDGGGQGDAAACAQGVGAVGEVVAEPQVEVAVAAVPGAEFVVAAPGEGCEQAGAAGFLRGASQGDEEARGAFLRGFDQLALMD